MNSNKFSERTQFSLNFAYLSKGLYGVQQQPNFPTVLGNIRKRIEKAANKTAKALMISARTDRFVTALDNYATFWLKNPVNINELENILNHNDDQLYGLKLKVVSPHVNARGSSLSKYYRYTIIDDCDPQIITSHELVWRIAPKLDILLMQEAAKILQGVHDFSSFRASGCSASTPVKNVYYIKISKNSQGYIFIDIEADAFLRKMIRNIVGLLVEIGTGIRNIEDLEQIIQAKNRQCAGFTAPAMGLMLIKVKIKN